MAIAPDLEAPDLETSLADMEQLLEPLLEQLAAGFLRRSVTRQGERLPATPNQPAPNQPATNQPATANCRQQRK